MLRYWIACLGIFSTLVADVRALNGTVQSVSFSGPITGRPVTFSLYLPPGYADEGNTNRYPVVYHLHGSNGSHNGDHTNSVPASLEAAVTAGVIGPCILVFPDGYTNSMWADSFDGIKPAETDVALQVIPYVDEHYRTWAARAHRAVQGFSMGGFGAAKFAAKFPDLFCACVIYDGALLTWATLNTLHPGTASGIFNNSESAFDAYSPWYWLPRNAEVLRADMRFRQVVGALTSYGRSWRDFLLLTNAIANPYVETGLPHTLDPILDAEGSNTWVYLAQAFAAAAESPLTPASATNEPGVVLHWPSVPGERFDILHNTNLMEVRAWVRLATNIPAASGSATAWVHSNGLLNAAGFYGIERKP